MLSYDDVMEGKRMNQYVTEWDNAILFVKKESYTVCVAFLILPYHITHSAQIKDLFFESILDTNRVRIL